MLDLVLRDETDFSHWRCLARAAIARHIPPERIAWRVRSAARDLLATEGLGEAPEGDNASQAGASQAGASQAGASLTVPRRFVALAETFILHRHPGRFGLLYRLLWRIQQGERTLLTVPTDPDVDRAETMAKAVRRDIHKMKAFVRFREVRSDDDPEPRYLAWFEPEHFIVAAVAPFFVRRFATMRWSILTPDLCAHWGRERLTFAPGASRAEVPAQDAREEDWRRYYASIFNPARLNPAAMKAQMPVKYWKNLPEARLIAPLVAEAGRRTEAMITEAMTTARSSPPPTVPDAVPPRMGRRRRCDGSMVEPPPTGLDEIRGAVSGCRRCPLWEHATQAVFGEGPPQARLMLVGEQPGDQEDIAGRPFVGPAGAVLDRALRDAGIDRGATYVTNAVKHFKFVIRGKRRMHQNPAIVEIDACRPWLEHEIQQVSPRLVVALGSTAARALLRRTVAIQRDRGLFLQLREGVSAIITIHPSFLLRLPDERARAAEYERFVADLALAQKRLAGTGNQAEIAAMDMTAGR